MFFAQIEKAPLSNPKNKVSLDAATGKMDIEVTTRFSQNLTGDYKVVVVIVEDSIKSTTSAYNQSNAYAGGASGVMGGYEKLANPVSYTKMVYMHVARALIGTYKGQDGSLPSAITADTDYKYKTSFAIPATWKLKNLKVISMVTNPAGQIDNASEISSVDFTSGIEAVTEHPAFGGIYPNPSSDVSNIQLNLTQATNVQVRISDLSGKLVASKMYGELNGDFMLPIQTAAFDAGMYLVQIQLGDELLTKKLIIKR